jgi:hypothetical protein
MIQNSTKQKLMSCFQPRKTVNDMLRNYAINPSCFVQLQHFHAFFNSINISTRTQKCTIYISTRLNKLIHCNTIFCRINKDFIKKGFELTCNVFRITVACYADWKIISLVKGIPCSPIVTRLFTEEIVRDFISLFSFLNSSEDLFIANL